MDLPNSTTGWLENHDPAPENKPNEGCVSLFVRLWTYGDPAQPLDGLAVDADPEVAELIRSLITEGHGQIVEQKAEVLAARFNDPFCALAAAKTLQQRLLTFHRKSPPQQVVSSILISGGKSEAIPVADLFSEEAIAAADLLGNGNSAQILVSEWIYEATKNAPGFSFSPQPVREAGEGGASEAIYELLWTDESTYGHLRKTSRGAGLSRAGRYQILSELGRGAMGVVYKAHDQLIGRTVALKTISVNRNAPAREELIERLKQEAKAAGGLDHPNIVTIYDVGQEDDLVYLSMQFLEGKTLQALLAEGERPSLATLVSYADQICSAVGFAHARGVIHRDLKPANLMLTSQGVIKVLDFGIAKIEDATLTQTGLVVGTPSHMAPEQIAGKKLDQRADIFALGSVFYELVTSEKPFKGDVTTVLYKIMHEDPVPPSVINPALPGGIDAIIRKALAKDPNDRFQNCEEMREAFREQGALLPAATRISGAAAGSAAAAKMAPRPASSTPNYLLETTTLRRRRRWIGWVTVLMLALAGVAGWAFYVKSHTGSFPPMVQKSIAAWHGRLRHWTGKDSNDATPSLRPQPADSAGSQTGQNNPANPSASVGTANSAGGTASGASPADATPAPAPQENAGGSAAPSQPATVIPSSGNPPQNEKSVTPAENLHTSNATTSVSAGPVQTHAGAQNLGGSNAAPQSTTMTQSSSALSQKENAQPAANPGNSSSPTSAQDPGKDSAATADDPSTTAPDRATKNAAKHPSAAPVRTVEGFSRRDVPELLREADAAAGRGDYRLARYEYNLILKLDHNNAGARTGLRRVQAAEQDRAQ